VSTTWQGFKKKIIRRALFLLLIGIPTTALSAEIMNEFAVSSELATELAGEAEWLWQIGKDEQKSKPKNNL
jgi:hypothetical protein